MITGIFAFHHNTIIPLKKVSGSLESDTFFGDCFNSIISQPLFRLRRRWDSLENIPIACPLSLYKPPPRHAVRQGGRCP
jgi:hypothetical protein